MVKRILAPVFPAFSLFFWLPASFTGIARNFTGLMRGKRSYLAAGSVLILSLLTVDAHAQKKIISGIVKDSHSEERIPFASVSFRNTMQGMLTDSSGTFLFYLDAWPSDTLDITCVGYQPFRFRVDPSKDSIRTTIMMERGTFNEGASVKIKVNKGLLVWRKIVERKPFNDRYRFDNFSYESYNKLELDIKNINFEKFGKFKPLKPISDLIRLNIDTMEGLTYLPSYLTEALSDYYYQKDPKKRREIIKAANTNGVKNESMLKLLGSMDQVVNVYNNFIPVMDKQFVSPISDNGDAYYQYRVVDTQAINNNRYYHLVFTPKRAGTNTFEGDCWVHVGSFAIQKMNLRLGKEANINFIENLSLIQEYKLIDDSTWFLSKDKFVVDISPIGKEKPGFIGRKTTTYRDIIVNDSSVTQELKKNKILEEIITLPQANKKERSFWTTARHEELNKNEAAIIRMIDTLMTAPVFKKFTNTMYFLGAGYKNIGKFEIGPWFYWISSNSWEGLRLRFDLGTNKHFNEKLWLHTYLAYGFRDRKWKGMGEFFYLPGKTYPRSYINGSYRADLDFGQTYFGEVTSDNIFSLAIRKNYIPRKNIQVKEYQLAFFREMTPWFSNRLVFKHTASLPLRNLLPIDSFRKDGQGDPLKSFEVAFRVRFAFLEKFLDGAFFRASLGSPYPTGEIHVVKGFPGVFKSNYKYTKVFANASDNFKIPPFGNISWFVFGGKTFGTLPYTLLDVALGNELYYYNKYAFNMMNRWEFVHDEYAGINIEHNFGNGIFRLFPKLKFRQFWTAKTLWGSLTPANRALNFKIPGTFQTLDGKTYLELGTGIDNIFHLLRIDFIWRVLPQSISRADDRNFGIFGSIRLSF